MISLADNKTMEEIKERGNRIIKELKKEIEKKGYRENLGQKKAREFNEWLDSLRSENEISYKEMAHYSDYLLRRIYSL